MKKYVGLLLVALWLAVPMLAQTKVDAQQQKAITEKIGKSTSGLKDMQCDFEQVKRMKMMRKDMVSKGLMYYKTPNQLRWEYTTPYNYVFLLNKGEVNIKSSKSSKKVDVKENKIFQQVTKIILGCITGDGLRSEIDFRVEIYQSGSGYSAKLYPKKKELKQIYQHIEIFFNASLTMVSQVRMVEKTGDETLVKLLNVKTNTGVNEKVFSAL